MRKFSLCFLVAILFGIRSSSAPLTQDEKHPPVCKASVLAKLRPLPKLRYPCGSGNDYDEKILKLPARLRALKAVESRLALISDTGWWSADVDGLNACYVRRRPGKLTEDETSKFNYGMVMSGNNRIRVVIVEDPCYQTGYNGSDVFLLSRLANAVGVTEVIDGYFSRADNSVGVDYGNLKGQEIIEVYTSTGGLHPDVINYYFTIDKKTNKAVPKRLFKGEKGLDNTISSAMLLSDPEDAGLPKDAGELSIIRDHKFAPSFSVYSEDDSGDIEVNDRKFKRHIMKWNGRFYE